MIKTTKKEIVKYILELEEPEARWLAGLMQNPIFEDEEYQEAEMRQKFFEAVQEALYPKISSEQKFFESVQESFKEKEQISYTDFEEEQ